MLTTYDGFQNIHAFDYFAKRHVPAVDPFSDLRRDEELSTIQPDPRKTARLSFGPNADFFIKSRRTWNPFGSVPALATESRPSRSCLGKEF